MTRCKPMLVMSWGLMRTGAPGPLQAAAASAAAFSAGAILPLIAAILPGKSARILLCVVVAAIMLIALGDLGARLGGAPRMRAIVRVTGWGLLAMGVTAGVGTIVG
jgi:VIT1/CCC1 family predicted Fe2+/Mn2+ transporter